MSDQHRPLKVFLCHAHADRSSVRALYNRLLQDGVDAWLDKEKLLPGQDWELEIRKAVREADVVIICLSKQFNQAGFRQKEVRLALDTAMEQPEGEIFIIPARLEECDSPESLGKWHWVDLFENAGYQILMRALQVRANKINATLQINRIARENKEHDVPENANQVRIASEMRQRQVGEAGEKDTQENVQKEVDKRVTEIQRQLKREIFRLRIRNKLNTFALHLRFYIFPVILIFGAIAGVLYLGRPFFENTLSAKEGATDVQVLTPLPSRIATEAFVPTEITPQSSSSSETEVVATSLPIEITDAKGVSMVLVPEGEFIMGSNNNVSGYPYDVQTPHKIYLADFYIDKYEVTNKLYKDCVDKYICQPPSETGSNTRLSYYGTSLFDQYPVIYVDWEKAKTYCEWRGARLPTEAEWEKAARGSDGRTYPWGEEIDCTYTNYGDYKKCGLRDTTEVGSYNKGVSPFGIYDMTGNVEEWTQTCANGKCIMRGGAWYTHYSNLKAYLPYPMSSINEDFAIGFRCARHANP